MPLVPCPACSHSVSDLAPTCPQCGHPLRPAPAEVPPSASTAVAHAPVPTPAPEPPDPLRCICGTWNRVGDVRCLSCQRPLGQSVTGRRPVHYVTAPLTATPRDPERERREWDAEAAETLANIALVCALVGIFVWPLFFGLIALACGIPAYLRGSRRALTAIVVALIEMGLTLLFLLFALS